MHEATCDPPAAVDAERLRIAHADQRIAAARARVEQLGGTLHIVGAAGRPSFLVCRWCLTRDLSDIEALETWLAQVEPRG